MGIKRLIRSAFGDGTPDPRLVLRRGIDFFKQGDTHRALQCFERITSKHPHCSDAHYWEGYILHSLGLHEEALRRFNNALEVEPESKMSLFQKGNCLACLARFEEAIVCYALALDIDPQFSEALKNISVCYRRLGEYKKAMECSQEAERANGTYLMRLRGGT